MYDYIQPDWFQFEPMKDCTIDKTKRHSLCYKTVLPDILTPNV